MANIRRGSSGARCVATRVALMFLLSGGAGMLAAAAQQPAEPVDISPINGEVYYLINQLSGLQADLNNGSTTAGAALLQQPRSFTSLTQRWALTRLSGNFWAITNLANGLCMDASAGSCLLYTSRCV